MSLMKLEISFLNKRKCPLSSIWHTAKYLVCANESNIAKADNYVRTCYIRQLFSEFHIDCLNRVQVFR